MYRFLLTRQWVILTLIGVVLMPAMVELGIWQMHRHETENRQNAITEHSLAAPAVPVGELTAPGATVPNQDNFRTVTVTGHYDPSHQVVVRHRTSADDTSIGYYLVTPLITSDGRAILINRGWIPAASSDTQYPPVPRTPTGQLTITGRIRPDETTASTGIRNPPGMPAGMVMLINSHEFTGTLHEPVLGGYVELTRSSPAIPGGQPELVPPPTPGQSNGGWNPPHLAYAWQWWLFVAMVPVGWLILVRRELKDRRAKAAKAAADAGSGADSGAEDDDAVTAAASAP